MLSRPRFFFTVALLLMLFFFSKVSAQSFTENLKRADSLYQLKDYSGARKLYEAALDDTAKNGAAWSRLGFAYYNLGHNNAAMSAYEKALSYSNLAPLKASVYSRMARINSLKNKRDEALANIDSAVRFGYLLYYELDTLKDFSAIRNNTRFKELRTKAYNAAYPCMNAPQAREFDFWVGEWDVYITGTKNCVGHSLIQIVSGGCAILENWSSNSVIGNGKSLNFIDPATNKWRQTWVGNDGLQEFINGVYSDDAMRFTFESTDNQHRKLIGRFIFYNQGPRQVRQFNETSADEGKTWTTSYDFTYIKAN